MLICTEVIAMGIVKIYSDSRYILKVEPMDGIPGVFDGKEREESMTSPNRDREKESLSKLKNEASFTYMEKQWEE